MTGRFLLFLCLLTFFFDHHCSHHPLPPHRCFPIFHDGVDASWLVTTRTETWCVAIRSRPCSLVDTIIEIPPSLSRLRGGLEDMGQMTADVDPEGGRGRKWRWEGTRWQPWLMPGPGPPRPNLLSSCSAVLSWVSPSVESLSCRPYLGFPCFFLPSPLPYATLSPSIIHKHHPGLLSPCPVHQEILECPAQPA